MNCKPLRVWVFSALAGLVPTGLFAAGAWADSADGKGGTTPTTEGAPTIGGAPNPLAGLKFPVTPIPNQNLTPEQLQMLMQMRALQSRGGRGIRTGYPQFIPLGMQGMMPFNQGMWPANQYGAQGNGPAGDGNQNGPNGALGGNQDAAADPANPQPAVAARKSTKERRAEAKKAAEEKKKAAREAREARLKEKAAKAKEAKTARDAKKAAPAGDE